jgi:ribonucleoside-diphosphate reductase alpha chain
MNALFFDRWKDTGSVFIAIVLLDCLCSEFIDKAKDIVGLEKAVRYTKKARSLGLGLLGFHSHLQSKMIAFEEYEAHRINIEIFSHLQEESKAASKWIAEVCGEPEWCVGTGYGHTHLLACAPNMSSAVLAGQVSQGIEPILANAFLQPTAAGEMQRINPTFLKLAEERGKLSKALIRDIISKKGSVQHLTWLSDHEKLVFKTAFEIDQRTILRLASIRQRYIDQGQSLNLFFSSEENEEYILQIHEELFTDPYIKGSYYIRSESGIMASTGECVACAS